MTVVAGTVQAFFTERLIGQRRASPHTVAAYRDAIRLLLNFSAERTGAVPCRLDFTDLDAPVISAFLDYIERERGNTIRSRNARLAAIHSLFSFAALRHPEHAADSERVLAILPSGPTRQSSRSSPPPRPRHCSPLQTGQPDRRRICLDTAAQTAYGPPSHRPDLPGCPLGGGVDVACHGAVARPDHAAESEHRRHLADRARRTHRDTRRPVVHHHPRRTDEPRRLQQRLTLCGTVVSRSCELEDLEGSVHDAAGLATGFGDVTSAGEMVGADCEVAKAGHDAGS